jgi:glycosyltransferase involved in cell wall biosynthesis
VIDAHFAYPDGYAATLLGKWLKVPVTITLRGTEVPLSKTPRRRHLIKALDRATRVFSVSDSLRRHVVSLGANSDKINVVGNGVDIHRFYQLPCSDARKKLGLPEHARVLITVGGLVERKGFHRVIELLPEIRKVYPEILYLIVGGASAEGDWSEHLKQMVNELRVSDNVKFLGVVSPDELNIFLSAADIFVLPTRNEGWANVILEAMACGLPVIATDVGGNSEVICRQELGAIVPFEDREALKIAILDALNNDWDADTIINYAKENSWDDRVKTLVNSFVEISQ